jgi:RimJ/RimL family protein N-acetyltransferase
MRFERFNPRIDADRIDACYQIFAAGRPLDDPLGPPTSARGFAAWWAFGWTGQPLETWLATGADGDPVGCYLLELPEQDNRTAAGLVPLTRPDRRRSGVGSSLLRHGAERAAAAGRDRLWSDTRVGSPGAAFAAARGANPGLIEVMRALEVTAIPAGKLATLRAEADEAATGYTVVSWQGPVPDQYLEQAAIVTAAIGDAPRDPGLEAQVWDGERIRVTEQRLAVSGVRSYSVAARHDASGELAGLTQLEVDPETPEWGFQAGTMVTRRHRGHRLGLLIKVAMLEWLSSEEPRLARIVTGNADSNQHMIAINERLGFQVLDRWQTWELGVADALKAGLG